MNLLNLTVSAVCCSLWRPVTGMSQKKKKKKEKFQAKNSSHQQLWRNDRLHLDLFPSNTTFHCYPNWAYLLFMITLGFLVFLLLASCLKPHRKKKKTTTFFSVPFLFLCPPLFYCFCHLLLLFRITSLSCFAPYFRVLSAWISSIQVTFAPSFPLLYFLLILTSLWINTV